MSARDVHNSFEGGMVLQTTDAQVRKLMKEIRKTGKILDSALRSVYCSRQFNRKNLLVSMSLFVMWRSN